MIPERELWMKMATLTSNGFFLNEISFLPLHTDLHRKVNIERKRKQ
jgi:hypothetical protein